MLIRCSEALWRERPCSAMRAVRVSVIVVERKGESVSVYVSVQCDGRNMSDTPGPTI